MSESSAHEESDSDASRRIETPISQKQFPIISTCLRSCGAMYKSLIREINSTYLDKSEKIIIVLFYIVLVTRMTHAYLMNGHAIQLLYILDQLIVLIFFVLRRATEKITKRLQDLLVSYVGFIIPLLMGPISPLNAIASTMVSTSIMFLGGGIFLLSKLTLRRSFGIIPANRGIKTSGLYLIVRHPMYLGYIISLSGYLLSGPNFTNMCLLFLTCLFIFWRINAEERLLIEDPNYRKFMRRTRFRLFPGVY